MSNNGITKEFLEKQKEDLLKNLKETQFKFNEAQEKILLYKGALEYNEHLLRELEKSLIEEANPPL